MDVVRVLKDLVRINTTNPPGEEEKLHTYLESVLTEAGIPFVRQTSAPGRGNLLAAVKAKKPSGQPPLVLLSHIDVVAARPEEWCLPPFAAEEKDGYIYGRGTVDTKQLTVMELAALLALKESDIETERDVYFLATCDEEKGSTYGLKYFLSHSVELAGEVLDGKSLFENADVISEGGGFPIVAGEKEFYLCESGQKSCGAVEFIVKARGSRPFVPSPDGMARAMGLVREIGSMELEGRVLDTVARFEEALNGAELSPMMKKILFAMKHNTMTVTMIEGKNTDEIHVTCDIRLLPGFDSAYLMGVLDRLAKKWDCEAVIKSLGCGYESDIAGGTLDMLEAATLKVLNKTKDQAQILPFVSMGSSDGHLLADYHSRVYGYSPVYPWDMTFDSAVSMVHGVNERIHRDSVIFGSDVLTEAVRRIAGGKELE